MKNAEIANQIVVRQSEDASSMIVKRTVSASQNQGDDVSDDMSMNDKFND
ncbi:MAG: hypothetical protein LBJ35_03800 [Spirochaetaceae bacterium]|jgi:hypothetical protein|nr:hypothetical protein [Spirochaetaceae bacterium]